MAVYEFHTRVSYDDIGEDRSLTLRGAMSMMQEAAIIHSDMIGYSINDVQRTHVIWMLIQWRIRMIGKAFWNDRVIVKTWPRTMERATSERDFKIVDEAGKTVAIGESFWVLVNADTGRIARIPPEILRAYDLTAESVFEDEFCEPRFEAGGLTASGVVLRRDIDTNHHVNNRVYLDYAAEVLPDGVAERSGEVFVRYRKQLLLGQSFYSAYKHSEKVHGVDICDENGNVHASVIYT